MHSIFLQAEKKKFTMQFAQHGRNWRESPPPPSSSSCQQCDTMWPFVVLGVCVCQSENLFVCFGVKPTQRTRSPTRPEVEEARKVPEKTEGQLTKEDGESQLTMESRGGRSAWDSSPGEGRSAEEDSKGRQSKMSWHS